MTQQQHDVVVVGAGPAGEVIAGRLAAAGLDVVIVEDRLVGGECSFWACMPSKALLRPAEALAEARRVPGAAEAARGTLDVQAVLDRRDEVVHGLSDDAQLPWLEDLGIALVRGHARFTGERRLAVGDVTLEARRAVVVATGSAPAVPPVPGLREAEPWTNREITVAKHVPARLLVLGGGVVGCEMAQAWATLGATVTLVEPSGQVLGKEEPFAAEQVEAGLRAAGVRVHKGQHAASVSRPVAGGEVTVVLEDGTELVGDELLAATGRRPLTDDLGLETIGLEPGGYLEVDEQLRSSTHPWLVVVGDANGRALLTHMGKHQARIAADALLGRPARLFDRGDGHGSPRVTFTSPQVAAVGLTLAAAEEAGLRVRAVDVGTSANAGGSFWGNGAEGTTRLVVDEDRRVVVGATITGAEVQDFLHAATIAVVGQVSLDDLWHSVAAFPTRSELWLKLLEEYGL
ncbi:MAG: FAD-dependent pyridine nucleotide-disulfide oxidoreductase [Solirubrobacterales bacterium]|nr:FAD-dependent pyridine nucleotide-disulfide oxidoreductase [Solirubrobacterales bacterium]